MAKREEREKKLKNIIKKEIASADGIESVTESLDGSFDVRTSAGPLRVVVEKSKTP